MEINRYNRIILPVFFLFDLSLLAFLFVGWFYALFGGFKNFFEQGYIQLLVISLMAWVYLSIEFRTYHVERRIRVSGTIIRLLTALLFLMAVYFGYIVLLKYYHLSRMFNFGFILLFALSMLLVTIGRYLFVLYYRAKGGNTLRIALIIPEKNHEFKEAIGQSDLRRLGYQVAETIIAKNAASEKEIEAALNKQHFDEVFIVDPSNMKLNVDLIVDICDNLGIRVKLLPGYLKKLGKRLELDYVDGYPIMELRNEPLLFLHNRLMKRMLDTLLSALVILFILSWLTLLLWLANLFSSPGPVFFKQYRIGRDGKVFVIYKYRTMRFDKTNSKVAYVGADKKTERNDPRITAIGKLLRKTNLDELPQFINVFKGQMSIVGPRPHMNAEDEQLAKKIPKYPVRRFVKPGITGWAQIHGYRGGTEDMAMMKKRTEYDIYYLENWTLLLDIKIIFITAWQMLTMRIPNAY
jgi:putative colanic acid biosysnthesis UDP-glucose lipid carrier transferase